MRSDARSEWNPQLTVLERPSVANIGVSVTIRRHRRLPVSVQDYQEWSSVADFVQDSADQARQALHSADVLR